MKVCSKCKLEKELDRFSFSKYGKNGLNSHCKDCANAYYKTRREYSRNYRNKNKDKEKIVIERYQSKMTSGVYRLWTEDGDYIGESIKMERRIWNHKKWNDRSPIKKPILGWEVLEVVQDETQRKQREIYWIKKLNPSLNNKDYHWGSRYQ